VAKVTTPKYKSRIKVLDSGSVQGVCSCTWAGTVFTQDGGIALVLATVQSEIQSHKHVPKPKKEKKNVTA
jgi:hypothetical protein